MPYQFTCERCGKEFTRPTKDKSGRPHRYCSVACWRVPRPGIFNRDGTVTVIMTKGCVATIDAEDAADILSHSWTATRGRVGGWYAYRQERGTQHKMHRQLMPDCAEDVDHIDGDGLNNRRSNLRCASRGQNLVNRGLKVNNTTGYKGVIRAASPNKWRAEVKLQGRAKSLGVFDSPEAAARAYDNACRSNWGDFCQANFPEDHQPPPPG